MARICKEKATGKIIEYQSDATPGTLLQNALSAGYKEEDVIEIEVTPSEWATLKLSLFPAPAPAPTKEEYAAAVDQASQIDLIAKRVGLK